MLDIDASKLFIIWDKRLTIKEATKHIWFVNVKSKIKSLKVERKREMSEMDVIMTII